MIKSHIWKNFSIILYSKKYEKSWEDFVFKSNNGTIFHTRKFLSYHKKKRFIDSSLLFFKNSELIAVMPAALVKTDKGQEFSSHPGLSYGGIIHKENLGLNDALVIIEILTEYLKKNNIKKINLVLTPLPYHKHFCNYIDFALYKQGFIYKKRELTSIVTLPKDIESLSTYFKPEARTALRKAIKSRIIIRQSKDFYPFFKILKDNLDKRFGLSPTHTYRELLKLFKLFPDKIRLIGAYNNNKIIAGVVNFKCNDRVTLAFYIAQKYSYQSYRPLNLLFYEILKDCILKRIDLYDFGLFTANTIPNFGLARFKENLGGSGVFRDYYQKMLL